MYGLDGRAPPEQVLSPNISALRIPWAPHLEECAELTRRREESEEFVELAGSPGTQASGGNVEQAEGETAATGPSRRRMQEGAEIGGDEVGSGDTRAGQGTQRGSEEADGGITGDESGNQAQRAGEDDSQNEGLSSARMANRRQGQQGHQGQRGRQQDEEGQQGPKAVRYPDWACASRLAASGDVEESQMQQRHRGLELCDDPRPPWVGASFGAKCLWDLIPSCLERRNEQGSTGSGRQQVWQWLAKRAICRLRI